MQFCAAQIVCLCLGMVAVGLLHKFGVTGFKQEESFGNVFLGTLSFQGAAWLLILVFLAAASRRLARSLRFSRARIETRPAYGAWIHRRCFAGRAAAAIRVHQRTGKTRLSARRPGRRKTADECKINLDNRLSRRVRGRAGAGRGGIYFSRNAVSVRQTAWPAQARVVRRQLFVRADPLERADICAAVRVRAGADLALRTNGQPARADHRARAVQRGRTLSRICWQ